MEQAEKVRENRARRALARRGLRLERSRRRDAKALDFGRYRIVREDGTAVTECDGLAGVETWLAT